MPRLSAAALPFTLAGACLRCLQGSGPLKAPALVSCCCAAGGISCPLRWRGGSHHPCGAFVLSWNSWGKGVHLPLATGGMEMGNPPGVSCAGGSAPPGQTDPPSPGTDLVPSSRASRQDRARRRLCQGCPRLEPEILRPDQPHPPACRAVPQLPGQPQRGWGGGSPCSWSTGRTGSKARQQDGEVGTPHVAGEEQTRCSPFRKWKK